ncbi:MAG: Y-family DNA polymerase [Steroidobacteraceae bacterium]
MKSRAVTPATADLFAAAADAATADAATAGAAAEAPAQRRPAFAAPPPLAAAARSRSKHVWYAAVFAPLTEAEPSASALQRLCVHAQQFTSLVSMEMPNALLLEINGSVRLFGSLERLHACIDAAWARLKLCAHSAIAPSTLAALWFARSAKRVLIEDPGSLAGALAPLPLTCTGWDAERLKTLRAMGVTRVGELLRLPRAGLARRFGPAAMLDLDIALGRQAAPRRVFVRRERFRERCDFEAQIDTVAYLLKALEPLVARCARFLRERQAGVQALELRLRHRARPGTRLRLGLASITGEQRRLTDVLVHQLSRLELAAPALSMELLSGPLQPLSAASLEVFAPVRVAGGGDSAPQLVERLRARLGEEAVYGLCSIPEHRPEAAWQRVRELSLEPTRRRIPAQSRMHELPEHGMPRPVWLLDVPVLLAAPPVQPPQPAGLILEQGPERIESGWWDGHDIARDYYIARRTGGERLWVFQERQSKGWYLHGVFA